MSLHSQGTAAAEITPDISEYAYIDTKPSLPPEANIELKQEPIAETKQAELKPDVKPKPESTTPSAVECIRVVEDFGHKTFVISGVRVHFPFQPYPSQLGMMNHMIRALNSAQNTMIESPTGSGKSLALLCAVLAWRQSFEAKHRQTLANVRQTIRRYSEHNSMAFVKQMLAAKHDDLFAEVPVSKEGSKHVDTLQSADSGNISDEALAEAWNQIIPGSQPLVKPDPEQQVVIDTTIASPMPKPDADITPIADASPVFLLNQALSYMRETVQFILDQAKATPPDGLTAADMDELRDYTQNAAQVKAIPRIYFGTRTHKQVSQLVNELRRKTPYRLRSAVLGSRAQTCINHQVKKSGSIDEECRKLVDDSMCGPHHIYRKLLAHKKLQRQGDLEIWDLEDIETLGRETRSCPYFAARDLSGTADLVFCPYNYILDPGVRGSAGVELEGNVVILDEAHNVENAARDSGSLEITDEQLHVVAAECRMMVDRGTLRMEHETVGTLASTLVNWLKDSDHPYEYLEFDTQTAVWPRSGESLDDLLERILLSPQFVAQLQKAVSVIEGYIKDVRSRKEKRRWDDENNLNRYKKGQLMEEEEEDSRHLSTGSMRLLEQLLRVLGHLAPDSPFRQDYRVACIRKSKSQHMPEGVAASGPKYRPRKRRKIGPDLPASDCVNVLAFWALNPGVVFSEIASKARTIVLTSGTLSPLDSYASELQVKFSSTLEANHVIDSQRFRALAVECGTSGELLEGKYKNVDLLSFQDDLGNAIAEIVSRSPDGMLVFVPSYSLLAKLMARWKVTECLSEIEVHKRVFIEPQGGSKEEFDRLLTTYRDSLAKNRPASRQPALRGAIMFAVYRGKVSEGIDFSDYFCRTVVNIGIPYPAFKDVKVVLKRQYNDDRSTPNRDDPSQGVLLNGAKWYDIQAFRAINQALGRCLRHKMDWGVIIMLESRFAQRWNVERLSKWVRQYMGVYRTFDEAKLDLDAFYKARIKEDIDAGIDDSLVNDILPACSSLGLSSPTTVATHTVNSPLNT
ncbi:hypothetical protein GGH94_001488 [Coemansia aciculifera]|uniref:DNA 5'-3' helicase n=1 Tax=Coemansia aciculifera TaxID=417176 RepID=A0A9W8M7M0_9FUNG|nr:hypothetical protein GGH94_001488 [Coemansia aciculifera]KAJ2875916.1 hypothetical protein GGH93_001187 [Coemansia aciculifera]